MRPPDRAKKGALRYGQVHSRILYRNYIDQQISRFSTTLVFPVEDLGARPDGRGFGALGPSENIPIFLKRRYAAQKFFFPRGRAKKSSPVCEKNGFEPGFEPDFSSFCVHFLTFFPLCIV